MLDLVPFPIVNVVTCLKQDNFTVYKNHADHGLLLIVDAEYLIDFGFLLEMIYPLFFLNRIERENIAMRDEECFVDVDNTLEQVKMLDATVESCIFCACRFLVEWVRESFMGGFYLNNGAVWLSDEKIFEWEIDVQSFCIRGFYFHEIAIKIYRLWSSSCNSIESVISNDVIEFVDRIKLDLSL